MKINNLNDLVSYVKMNFNELTDKEFQSLLNNTLFIYPLKKPETIIEAINMIEQFGNMPIEDRPLFPDITHFEHE
jgi:hypothetical protein